MRQLGHCKEVVALNASAMDLRERVLKQASRAGSYRPIAMARLLRPVETGPTHCRATGASTTTVATQSPQCRPLTGSEVTLEVLRCIFVLVRTV